MYRLETNESVDSVFFEREAVVCWLSIFQSHLSGRTLHIDLFSAYCAKIKLYHEISR